MPHNRPRLAVAILIALINAAPLQALDPSERQCQNAIATAGKRLLKRSLAALASCERAVARGGVPAGTDCLTDPTTAQKRAEAAAKSADRITQRCTDAVVTSLAPAGECSGARTVADVVACITGSHDAEAGTLLQVADPSSGPLSAVAQQCAAQASLQTRRYALARLRAIQQCKRSPRLLDLPPGTVCALEPSTMKRIASLRAQAAAQIAAECGAALTETPFGAPCDAPGTGDTLAQCLLSAADASSDRIVVSQYAAVSFCGDSGEAVEQRIDALLAQMTLAEKIEQMHGAALLGLSHTVPNDRLGIPGIVMIDGPRGVGVTLGNATAFPVGMARGATWDPDLEERVGEAVGTEARAKGASMILAPTINLLRHPRWGRAQETYGEDPFHLGRMAVGYVRGAQQHVIANPKHFAGNSIENTRFNVDVSMDERTLREIYLPHFRMAVQDGHAGAVMSAYNQLNGHYCGENPHLLHDVLKGDWGFRGFVESDWVLGTRSTVPAITAGLDIEMPAGIYYGQPLVDAVTGGQVGEDAIDGAVRRILRAQLCFRLDTDPPQMDPTQVESPAHTNLTLEVEREAIVLLKNSAAALPLNRTQVHSIVVVGPVATLANIGDLGSSTVAPSYVVTALQGIQGRAGGVSVTYVPSLPFSASDVAAVTAADAAVVVAGLTAQDEGEGQITVGDRTGLAMPRDQDQLITAVAALNPRTIVVLEGSGPILMPWVNDVAAILTAWYPGQEGGNAIADVLFGDVNPSGKLPLSFPRAEADLPPFDNVSLAVTYDYYHGYRYLDRNGTAALFPFGFGLSYTTFQYAHLTLAPATLDPHGRLRVTAEVTNTGAIAGDEIAQLYVSYNGSVVDRPAKDLKDFVRVHLEPGETETVVFEVRAADLAFWDTAAGGWEVEPITYTVRVGSSSQDLPLAGSFAVAP